MTDPNLTPRNGSEPQPGEQFVEARNPMERAVCQVWAEVLDLDRVGIHDDFFDLGGDSLLAIRVAFRLQEEFGVEAPMHSLFTSPTVADQTAALSRARPAETMRR
jgi:acyl carrier protein